MHNTVNATGALIDHIDYDSFGRVLAETNAAFGDRFKFAGREYDEVSGLYYYRARYGSRHRPLPKRRSVGLPCRRCKPLSLRGQPPADEC